jgi:hypothetical protein
MAAFRTPITSVALLPLVAAICEIIASVAPILPASSLATAPSLALLGMVLIISTPLKKTPNQTLSGEFSSAISAFQRGVSVAAGKTSIKDNVNNVFDTFKARAIRKISLYNGEDNDPVPTVQDYVDIGIGIGSVGDDNLSLKNLRIAAEKDRTKKDRSLSLSTGFS